MKRILMEITDKGFKVDFKIESISVKELNSFIVELETLKLHLIAIKNKRI